MRPAIVSGIVTGDASVSYWPIFFPLSTVTVPEAFAKVNSSQFSFVSIVANCLLFLSSNSTGKWDAQTCILQIKPPFPILTLNYIKMHVINLKHISVIYCFLIPGHKLFNIEDSVTKRLVRKH